MTSGDEVPSNPSLADFDGLYNVPKANGNIFIEPDVESSAIAPITFTEMNEVTDCLKEAGNRVGCGDGELYYDLGMMDRTACCAPRDSRLLTTKFVDSIQSQVLRKHPHWRVVVPASNEKDAFAIYPKSVKFNHPINSLDSEIKRIRDVETGIETKTSGDRDYQRKLIRRLLASSKLPATPFRPWAVGVFNTWRSNPQYMTVWVLESGRQSENQSWLAKDPALVAIGYHGRDDLFDVGRTGKIMPSYSTGKNFYATLTCHIFNKREFNGIVRLSDPATGTRYQCAIDVLRAYPQGNTIPGSE